MVSGKSIHHHHIRFVRHFVLPTLAVSDISIIIMTHPATILLYCTNGSRNVVIINDTKWLSCFLGNSDSEKRIASIYAPFACGGGFIHDI